MSHRLHRLEERSARALPDGGETIQRRVASSARASGDGITKCDILTAARSGRPRPSPPSVPAGAICSGCATMIVPLTILMVLLAVFAVEVAWLLAEPPAS